jgi:hypothetical protein
MDRLAHWKQTSSVSDRQPAIKASFAESHSAAPQVQSRVERFLIQFGAHHSRQRGRRDTRRVDMAIALSTADLPPRPSVSLLGGSVSVGVHRCNWGNGR